MFRDGDILESGIFHGYARDSNRASASSDSFKYPGNPGMS